MAASFGMDFGTVRAVQKEHDEIPGNSELGFLNQFPTVVNRRSFMEGCLRTNGIF